jgi:hypothetical protein
MSSDRVVEPQHGGDSFRVLIENHIDGVLNPLRDGSKVSPGDFVGEEGKPVSVKPYDGGPVPQAFFVHGTRIAMGVTGYVKYNIADGVLANIQFNSGHADGGQYFYAGVQPGSAGVDATKFYCVVGDIPYIPPQLPSNQHAFTPRIIVRPSARPFQTGAFLVFADPPAATFTITMINNTGEIMTLNEVRAPLGSNFQPAFASALPPYESGVNYEPYLVAYQQRGGSSPTKIDVVYNLADGAQINIVHERLRELATATFSGTNTERYSFRSDKLEGPYHTEYAYTLNLKLTIDRV